MISVIGGVYQEACMRPRWDFILGSAGRAAACIASKNVKVDLYSFLSEENLAEFLPTVETFGINLIHSTRQDSIYFDYFYPLDVPRIYPKEITEKLEFPGPISDKNMLVYGMLEANPVVHGERVVYDPQNGYKATSFSSNGSTAKHLVYILNLDELVNITPDSDPEAAIKWLFQEESPEAIIVKKGPLGAFVYAESKFYGITPPYKSRSVFKIGSGDVFSAAFAYFWIIQEMPIIEATDLASRSVAHYVETRDLQILDQHELLRNFSPLRGDEIGKVYLACPFFSIEQLWIVNQTKIHLEMLGAEVFSPMHEVGIGGDPRTLATKDLKGLDDCSCVIAILNGNDPGTIFEVGYAISRKIPVTILAERSNQLDLTMFIGTGCKIFDDYTTAIYSAIWDAFR